jgi:hypothetical protein
MPETPDNKLDPAPETDPLWEMDEAALVALRRSVSATEWSRIRHEHWSRYRRIVNREKRLARERALDDGVELWQWSQMLPPECPPTWCNPTGVLESLEPQFSAEFQREVDRRRNRVRWADIAAAISGRRPHARQAKLEAEYRDERTEP